MGHFRRKHSRKHPGPHSSKPYLKPHKLTGNSDERLRPADRRRLDAARSQT